MRDPNRIPVVLEQIEKLWRLHPDWRLGQLISNVAAWVDVNNATVWEVEDESLTAEIDRHLNQVEQPAETGR